MSALSALPSADGGPFRRYSGAPLEAREALPGRGIFAMTWRVHCRRPAAGAKGDVGHLRFPMSPLDTPLTFRWPLSKAFAAKREKRGLGSMRQAAYGTLSDPEVSLRYPPRITVRGRTLQGGSVPLRKAPLPSRACPWSTKRPCGPLAFRRATGGSRVQRRVWGVKRGKGTIGALSPLVSAARRRHPPPPGGGIPHAMSWRITPVPGGPLSPAAASRRNGGTAHPLLRVKAMGRKAASTGCAAVSAERHTVGRR